MNTFFSTRLFRAVSCFGCFAFFASFLSAQITVKGVVTDYETLEPVLNAELEIINLSSALQTRTNTEGAFTFENLPASMVCRLLVSAKGYEEQEIKFEAKTNNQVLKIPLFKSAQTNTTETVRQRFETKINTASRTFEKLADAPATVHIFTEQDIAERGYVYLIDILEDVPEIELNDKSNDVGYGTITVRGIQGNEKLLILLDGVRLSSGLTSRTPIDRNISIQHAKRVEVLLGPASALYGADAFTGVVNIVTKHGGLTKGGAIQTAYGRFNTIENNFRLNYGKRNHAFAVAGHAYISKEANMPRFFPKEYAWYHDHYKPYGSVLLNDFSTDTTVIGYQPYNNDRRGYSLLGVYTFKNNLDIGFSYNYQKHSSAVNQKPEYGAAIKETFVASSLTNLYVNHVFQRLDAAVPFALTSNITYNGYRLPYDSKYYNTYSGYQFAYKAAYNHNLRWSENVNLTFNDNQRLSLGTLFQYSYALPYTSDLPQAYGEKSEAETYYLGTNITDADGKSLAIPQDFYKFTQVNGGCYFQYQNDFNGKISFTTGMRFDGSYRKRTNGTESTSYLSFNPRAGLVFHPNDKWRFKVFYGSAFLAPSPDKLYEHYGSFVPTQDTAGNNNGFISYFFHLPNPNLNPELVQSVEFTTQYIIEKWAISANAYINLANQLVSDALDTSEIGTFKGAPVFTVVRPQNQDNLIAYGATVRAEHRRDLDPLGNKNLKFYANYTFSDGRIVFGDVIGSTESLRLFLSAMHTLKAGVHFQVKRLGIDVRAIARSGSYNSSPFNQIKNKGFVLLNAFVNYKVFEGKKKNFSVDAFIKVRNALNQKYYNAAISLSSSFDLAPQDPIRYGGGITVNFTKKR